MSGRRKELKDVSHRRYSGDATAKLNTAAINSYLYSSLEFPTIKQPL